MWKKCNIQLLPTDKAENSILITKYHTAEYHGKQYFTQDYLQANAITSKHLYITSDEEIKENDWVYDTWAHMNIIWQVRPGDIGNHLLKCYKIIASTDSSLKQLPIIPQSFIDKYISEYNKRNVITEIIVEYVDMAISGIVPVIKDDNTINISLIKTSWTREEVIELIKSFSFRFSANTSYDTHEWLEANL
jgi:hypothetical protein